MTLIPVHRGLITAGIVFCAGYGGWELLRYSRDGGALSLVVGLVFLLLAGALAYYLSRLTRFLGYGTRSGEAHRGPPRSPPGVS